MTTHRTIIRTVILVAGLWAVTPAVALANPLLSGYGGPGVGNQAILGSVLLNTPRGGSGGGGGSVAGAAGEGGLSNSAGAGTSNRRGPAGGSRKRSSAPASSTAPAQGLQGSVDAYRTLERTASASQPGTLSAQDFVYIALALCALAFTGAITRRLTRTTPAGKHG